MSFTAMRVAHHIWVLVFAGMTGWCESSGHIYIVRMKAKHILDWIREDVSDAKQKGQESIAVSALEKYLTNLENELTDVEDLNLGQQDAELAKCRAENERNLAYYNAQQIFSVEMFRAVIALGQSALKSAMVINGAAAATLMAFIGNLVVKQEGVSAVLALSGSIAYFSAGVLVAASAMGTTYFSQFSYSQDWLKWGISFHVVTVVLGVGAFVLFACGVWQSYFSIATHLVN